MAWHADAAQLPAVPTVPAVPGGAAMSVLPTSEEYVKKPRWWGMTDAQRRLSVETALPRLYLGGGKLNGLAWFEAQRLYQVAFYWDLGYPMTNSWEACAGGECWACMAFRDAVVCERKTGEIGVIEWAIGKHVPDSMMPPTPGK